VAFAAAPRFAAALQRARAIHSVRAHQPGVVPGAGVAGGHQGGRVRGGRPNLEQTESGHECDKVPGAPSTSKGDSRTEQA